MSLKIEGCSCARCKAYLFSEDDIVYCPICGAPHHRECYEALGHCALEELHGTEMQYSREKVLEALEKEQEKKEKQEQEAESKKEYTICTKCGESYDDELSHCPRCSFPNINKISGLNGFDLLGGVPADYKLDENVTAEDAKRFVASNTHRYIPKFATINSKNKISWNWMAFLFPCQWMFSRKMFKNGILLGLLALTVTLLSVPLNKLILNMGTGDTMNIMNIVEALNSAVPEMKTVILVLTFLGGFLDIGIRLFAGLFGDYIYKNHTISAIKRIKAESEDIAFDYRKYGGVNLIWFLAAYLALQYLPVILLGII